MTESDYPVVVLPGSSPDTWMRLRKFRRVLTARDNDSVMSVLAEAEQEALLGRWVAGFVTYEASAACDSALATHPHGFLPPAWFAVFDATEEIVLPAPSPSPAPAEWQESIPYATYEKAVNAIHQAIARGETYQVNFTFPLRCKGNTDVSAYDLFCRLAAAQRGRLGAFMETASFALCSASPELFFSISDDRIVCRPMKGTAPRGKSSEEDLAQEASLRASEKNRAENLMIVDMVRNDLGRIARKGSVQTTALFEIERYPNVLQMTSTIEAATSASIADIFAALFPSASVTGAPKVQTCGLIRQLEATPRGVYTGAMGLIGPGRRATFNVAIRTIQIDKTANTASYGTGSGIVWDSDARTEFEECRTKANVLTAAPWPEFQCLETLRWDSSKGWNFLEEHLQRLAASARYFGFACDREAILRSLEAAVGTARQSQRVRLTMDKHGCVTVRAEPWLQAALFEDRPPAAPPFMRATMVSGSADSRDVFLHHKTTHRRAYEAAKGRSPQAEEVLLVNERDELTEGTVGNLVLVFADAWITPALSCGLLPGIFRAALLRSGSITEGVLSPYDMQRADAAYLINSVRGWRRLAMRG